MYATYFQMVQQNKWIVRENSRKKKGGEFTQMTKQWSEMSVRGDSL
jgi:hypothetical protein